jgi:hypothetical protein
VFNYPPDYVVMGDTTLGRVRHLCDHRLSGELAYQVIYKTMSTNANPPTGTWINFSGIESLASNPAALVDMLNTYGLHGRMSPEMRNVILTSINAMPASNPGNRLRNAIYLLVTSPQYLVVR